jgi:hypothetical protein
MEIHGSTLEGYMQQLKGIVEMSVSSVQFIHTTFETPININLITASSEQKQCTNTSFKDGNDTLLKYHFVTVFLKKDIFTKITESYLHKNN